MKSKADRIKNQIAILEKELESEELLNDLWIELGPYGLQPNQKINPQLLERLRRYFNFNDDE